MANLKAKDADSVSKFLKATGLGTDDDPLIVEHSNPTALLQLQQSVAQLTTIVQQLADLAQLKNQLQTLIGVTGTINNFPATQLISGTVSVGNFPATQPISGTVSVGNFPATQPISGTVSVGNFPATQPISGTVSVGNFPSTQPISGTVSVGNFPATQLISGTVSISSNSGTQSITDSQTSYTETIFNLAAGASFAGASRDAQNKNTVRGWVWTNANGTLYIDQSINNSTWRQTDAIPITGNTAQVTDYVTRLVGRYYRLRYTNGNNAQTAFEIISTAFGIGL